MLTTLVTFVLSLGYQAAGPNSGAGQTPTTTPAEPAIVIGQNALIRDAARLWWFDYTITIRHRNVAKNDRPFRMPLIINGPWSELSRQTLKVTSSHNNQPVVTLGADQALQGTGVQGESMVKIPVDITAQSFARISIQAEVVSFSAKVDEATALATRWPAQWPAEVARSLQPQALIESDEPIFKETIDTLFGPNLRMMPPWIAAKTIVKHACTNFNSEGNRLVGTRTAMRGLNLQGARLAAQAGRGSRSDLVCVCVALLRAAGLPARPVVGFAEIRGRQKELTAWGEFYLPGSGWVPFSPWQMQNGGVRSWKPDRAWRYFGNWTDLKDHIPLAWSFAPGDGTTLYDAWSVWGWTRAVPWELEFPTPITLGTSPDGIKWANHSPATGSVTVTSGGPLTEAGYIEWKEGNRRPVRQGRRTP